MKEKAIVFIIVLSIAIFLGTSWAAEEMKGGMAIKKGDMVTVCKPGKACGKFETAVMDPKDCKCGAETEKLDVIKVEGDVAILCQCGGGCKCDVNEKNPYLCKCGNPVKVVRIMPK